MKYSLPRGELNNWKARITERLVECYFEENLVPRLKEIYNKSLREHLSEYALND